MGSSMRSSAPMNLAVESCRRQLSPLFSFVCVCVCFTFWKAALCFICPDVPWRACVHARAGMSKPFNGTRGMRFPLSAFISACFAFSSEYNPIHREGEGAPLLVLSTAASLARKGKGEREVFILACVRALFLSPYTTKERVRVREDGNDPKIHRHCLLSFFLCFAVVVPSGFSLS